MRKKFLKKYSFLELTIAEFCIHTDNKGKQKNEKLTFSRASKKKISLYVMNSKNTVACFQTSLWDKNIIKFFYPVEFSKLLKNFASNLNIKSFFPEKKNFMQYWVFPLVGFVVYTWNPKISFPILFHEQNFNFEKTFATEEKLKILPESFQKNLLRNVCSKVGNESLLNSLANEFKNYQFASHNFKNNKNVNLLNNSLTYDFSWNYSKKFEKASLQEEKTFQDFYLKNYEDQIRYLNKIYMNLLQSSVFCNPNSLLHLGNKEAFFWFNAVGSIEQFQILNTKLKFQNSTILESCATKISPIFLKTDYENFTKKSEARKKNNPVSSYLYGKSFLENNAKTADLFRSGTLERVSLKEKFLNKYCSKSLVLEKIQKLLISKKFPKPFYQTTESASLQGVTFADQKQKSTNKVAEIIKKDSFFVVDSSIVDFKRLNRKLNLDLNLIFLLKFQINSSNQKQNRFRHKAFCTYTLLKKKSKLFRKKVLFPKNVTHISFPVASKKSGNNYLTSKFKNLNSLTSPRNTTRTFFSAAKSWGLYTPKKNGQSIMVKNKPEKLIHEASILKFENAIRQTVFFNLMRIFCLAKKNLINLNKNKYFLLASPYKTLIKKLTKTKNKKLIFYSTKIKSLFAAEFENINKKILLGPAKIPTRIQQLWYKHKNRKKSFKQLKIKLKSLQYKFWLSNFFCYIENSVGLENYYKNSLYSQKRKAFLNIQTSNDLKTFFLKENHNRFISLKKKLILKTSQIKISSVLTSGQYFLKPNSLFLNQHFRENFPNNLKFTKFKFHKPNQLIKQKTSNLKFKMFFYIPEKNTRHVFAKANTGAGLQNQVNQIFLSFFKTLTSELLEFYKNSNFLNSIFLNSTKSKNVCSKLKTKVKLISTKKIIKKKLLKKKIENQRKNLKFFSKINPSSKLEKVFRTLLSSRYIEASNFKPTDKVLDLLESKNFSSTKLKRRLTNFQKTSFLIQTLKKLKLRTKEKNFWYRNLSITNLCNRNLKMSKIILNNHNKKKFKTKVKNPYNTEKFLLNKSLQKLGFIFISKFHVHAKNKQVYLKKLKYLQKKRRKKKLKLENRRRKKRKRFYPRPIWLRYSLYKKFLNKRYNKNFNKIKLNYLLYSKKRAFESKSHNSFKNQKSLGSNNKEKKQSFKALLYRNNKQKWGNFYLDTLKLEKNCLKKFVLATKIPVYYNENNYKISNLYLEFMPLYWKSYWLRNNLKPYMNRIKKNLSYQKLILTQQNSLEIFAKQFFWSNLLGFSKAWNQKIYTEQTSCQTNSKNFIEANFYKKISFEQSPLCFYANKKHSFENLQDFYFSNMHIIENMRLIKEHDRILFDRISEIIKNVKNNMTLDGEKTAVSYKLPKSKYNLLTNTLKLNKTNSLLNSLKTSVFQQLKPDFSFFSAFNLIGFFGKQKRSLTEKSSTNKPYASNATLRVLWAFNKTNLFSFKEKNSIKNLWETYKNREQSKSNQTKKFFKKTKNLILSKVNKPLFCPVEGPECKTFGKSLWSSYFLKKNFQQKNFLLNLSIKKKKLHGLNILTLKKLQTTKKKLYFLNYRKIFSIKKFLVSKNFKYFSDLIKFNNQTNYLFIKDSKLKNIINSKNKAVLQKIPENENAPKLYNKKSSTFFWWSNKNFEIPVFFNFIYFLESNYFKKVLITQLQEGEPNQQISKIQSILYNKKPSISKFSSESFHLYTYMIFAILFHFCMFINLLKLPELRGLLKFQFSLIYKFLNIYLITLNSFFNSVKKFQNQMKKSFLHLHNLLNKPGFLFYLLHGRGGHTKGPVTQSPSKLKKGIYTPSGQNSINNKNFLYNNQTKNSWQQTNQFKALNSTNYFPNNHSENFSRLYNVLPLIYSFQNFNYSIKKYAFSLGFYDEFLKKKFNTNNFDFIYFNNQKAYKNFLIFKKFGFNSKTFCAETMGIRIKKLNKNKYFSNFKNQRQNISIFKPSFNLYNIQKINWFSKILFLKNFSNNIGPNKSNYSFFKFQTKLSLCLILFSKLVVFSSLTSIQLVYKLLLKIIEIVESFFLLIYKFLEKPAELMIESIAQLFLIEWISDICTFIPETLDKNLWESFQKFSRPTRLFGFISFQNKNFILDSFISLPFNLIFFNTIRQTYLELWESLLKPDIDLYSRQKKGTYYMNIWAEIFIQAAEKYQMNVASLVTNSLEQEKFMERLLRDPEIFSMNSITPILYYSKNLLSISQRAKYSSNKLLIRDALLSATKNLNKIYSRKSNSQPNGLYDMKNINTIPHLSNNSMSINQHIIASCFGAHSVESDLFLDIAPPKSFQSISSLHSPIYFIVGPILCEVYSGLFSKKVSKNILLVTKQTDLIKQKSLKNSSTHNQLVNYGTALIQALAGETEMKLMVDNAKRYAVNFHNKAIGMRLLKDVFMSIALQTPSFYMLEDIHYIGEKRPMLLGNFEDESSNANLTIEQDEVHFQNQSIYQLSHHKILDYKRPYKGDSRKIPANFFSKNFYSKKFYKTFEFSECLESSNPKAQNFLCASNTNSSQMNFKILRKQKKHPLPLSFIERIIKAPSFNTNTNKKNKFLRSRLQKHSEEFFAPPSTSPFTILLMKDQKKLKLKKASYNALSSQNNFEKSSADFSNQTIRSKIAELADITLRNFSGSLDMITDLLVIVDSVRSNRGFVVFATTHLPAILDPALRRPGRFDETLCLPEFSEISNQIVFSSAPLKARFFSEHVLTHPRQKAQKKKYARFSIVFEANFKKLYTSSFFTNISGPFHSSDISNLFVSKIFSKKLQLTAFNFLDNTNSKEFKIKTMNYNTEKLSKNELAKILFSSSEIIGDYIIQADFLKHQTNKYFNQIIKLEKNSNLLYIVPLLFNSSFQYKDLILCFLAPKIVDFFYYSVCSVSKKYKSTNFLTKSKENTRLLLPNGQSSNPKDLIFSLISYRYLFQKNFIVSKMLSFEILSNSLKEPPGPPMSEILMPSKKYEAFKSTELDFIFKNSFSIHRKLHAHQKQRFLKKLYNQPIQFYFKSHTKFNDFSTFMTSFKELGFLNTKSSVSKTSLLKGSSANYYYKNVYNRHRFYITNQWWNGQLTEHNMESTFLSDVDWRSMYVQSVNKQKTQILDQVTGVAGQKIQQPVKQVGSFADQFFDFSDADQHYNPRIRKWVFNNIFFNKFNFENIFTYEIYYHFLMQSFYEAYEYFDKNRELLDYFIFKYLEKGSILQLNSIFILSRFYKR